MLQINMDPVYENMRQQALFLAQGLPVPSFYRDFAEQASFSLGVLGADPLVQSLFDLVCSITDNDLGHGREHITKVALDAGILVLVEGKARGRCQKDSIRDLALVQCAALLHDICRKEKNHAQKGALKAKEILQDFPLSSAQIEDVCSAIKNHEAFVAPEPVNTLRGALLSDCLYDADKFRWGPDNFTQTVWRMISYFKAPLSVFVERYPSGVESIIRIKETFRTSTGQIYGPPIIDAGLSLGEKLYEIAVRNLESR
ncbi:MAG: HD domain-containing protein [Desulfatibacillaceae bacterium]|nr:HD domain-containing protein [Desulfatibacillaceae bacterium]